MFSLLLDLRDNPGGPLDQAIKVSDRFLPKGDKVVVVGVITSKFGELENKDDIKRRLDEAAKFAPLEQLAVSPQCGFASTEEGNILSEEEQWAKLGLAVEVANEVWGK